MTLRNDPDDIAHLVSTLAGQAQGLWVAYPFRTVDNKWVLLTPSAELVLL